MPRGHVGKRQLPVREAACAAARLAEATARAGTKQPYQAEHSRQHSWGTAGGMRPRSPQSPSCDANRAERRGCCAKLHLHNRPAHTSLLTMHHQRCTQTSKGVMQTCGPCEEARAAHSLSQTTDTARRGQHEHSAVSRQSAHLAGSGQGHLTSGSSSKRHRHTRQGCWEILDASPSEL